MHVYPNAYYNYLKDLKQDYREKKNKIKGQIKLIYHEHDGTDGYRKIKVYLERNKIILSNTTVHKYMNKEMGLKSITRRKKQGYKKGTPHTIFGNKLGRNFYAYEKNQKWCTDFTYTELKDGRMRYNCSIIDLYDRSIVASITDNRITAELAVRTLKKALDSQPGFKGDLLLHSDQGSQYTSKIFVDFCKRNNIIQSMSAAGCPYDNAPMERYFNTLKNECLNLYVFETEEELYAAIEEFAYVHYNHVRPHEFNGYKTPAQKRFAA